MIGGTSETADRVHDALAILLDREVNLLKGLRHRMALLRLALLDGDPGVAQLATKDVVAATEFLADLAEERETTLSGMLGAGQPPIEIDDIAITAPDTHKAVLGRLVAERRTEVRLVEALRDSTKSIAEEGKRSVTGLLDLRGGPDGPTIITGGL
ncbi:MAG: hypothetical protein ACR2P0_14560 [Acidimicrobiales bacterium]